MQKNNTWMVLLMAGLLFGCQEDKPSIERWASKTQAMAKATVKPLHQSAVYQAEPFHFSTTSHPFNLPKVRQVAPNKSPTRQCWQPEVKGAIAPLERYPLAQLQLTGIMQRSGTPTGLLRAPDGKVHKVRTGSRLGLDNGQVVNVEKGFIVIEEVMADGLGCWQKRQVKLALNR
ncbi:pilus assembly protein PilP [Vibrio sp. SCSIO 43136]|uniref:pilus assembly protein PilP n=1 Tax=Vibrio sp. SCSIO 43136 TaxID=2819101 RepID=UPI0020753D25|nr:pilus assembly protein PilP [Vibrio sp. SCSIO 43136]USD65499.1 pilus assembly protein PilP [Vibrio sp. SCSIO 43136]